MSSGKTDDYWNKSSSTGFSFDDEDDTTKGIITKSTFNFEPNSIEFAFFSSPFDSDVCMLPVQTVISKKNLDAVLDDVIQIKPSYRGIKETITRMILQQSYDLICYRSYKDKLQLLDESINTMNGDVILQIVLFLAKTLNVSLFYNVLRKRKIALDHYISFLSSRQQTEQLSNLFLSVGHNCEMIEIFYMRIINIPKKEGILSKLDHFIIEHIGEIISEKEKLVLQDYQKFLRWLVSENSDSESLIEELANICKKVWENKGRNENKILEFKKMMNISDLQYEWILLNTLAAYELWDKIISVFIKSNWLTKKNGIKSVIDPEVFILGLNKHNPPKNIVVEFLNCLSDSELSFHLAKQVKCFKFIVDTFINQKDRQGLIVYKNQLPAQSEEYFYAESALHSSNIKWKN